MKKQVLRYLLAIVGVVLLIGLIASCGGDEPRFKVIDSNEYNAANMQVVGDALWDKYVKDKKPLSNPETIFASYKKDVDPLITNEMNKKNPTVGRFIVIKMDQYLMFTMCYWDNKPAWKTQYWIFNY